MGLTLAASWSLRRPRSERGSSAGGRSSPCGSAGQGRAALGPPACKVKVRAVLHRGILTARARCSYRENIPQSPHATGGSGLGGCDSATAREKSRKREKVLKEKELAAKETI